MMGGGSSMEVEIYGYDFNETDKLAAEMKQKLENIEGLRDVNISRQDYRMEYQIEFDREKLSLNGLTMATAAGAVRNRINGLTTTSYREEGEEYDIRVRYNEESRQSIEDVENILIYNPAGIGVRVRDLGRWLKIHLSLKLIAKIGTHRYCKRVDVQSCIERCGRRREQCHFNDGYSNGNASRDKRFA